MYTVFYKEGDVLIIFSKEEMYDADKYTINFLGVSSEILMENAGQAIVHQMLKLLKPTDNITIFSGYGNNGGDGIVIARRLKNLKFNVNLVLISSPSQYKGPSLYHLNLYKSHGYDFYIYDKITNQIIDKSTIIIDAIFGIGFKCKSNSMCYKLIEDINKSNAKIISVDIPSGVCANGDMIANAIKANHTFTISFPKLSAFLYPSKINYGKISVVDAGIVFNNTLKEALKQTWNKENFEKTLPPRKPNSHKGTYGKALIVGGSKYMPGAPILCAKACFTSGIGLLTLAVPKFAQNYSINHLPESTYTRCLEKDNYIYDFEIPDKTSVIACGPGLSRNHIVRNVVKKTILSNVPIILDADALYFLDDELIYLIKSRSKPTILTPHTGEMAKMCNCSVAEIETNRFQISKQKAIEWNCFLVLKGPHTILSTPEGNQYVNISGNDGLSKGGSGDVLTGIITAFITCHKNIQQAISNAIFTHGRSADLLLKSKKTTRDITPTDIINNLNNVFKEVVNKNYELD